MDNIIGTPTKISFSWTQIGDADPYVVIWGDGDDLAELDSYGAWEPHIITAP